MTDALNEQLSACLDGELPAAELDLLLKRVEREAELRAAIGRYSLIGEAMRAERPAVASRDFASKVMLAVAAEPIPEQAQKSAQKSTPTPNQKSARTVKRTAASAAAGTSRVSPAALRYLRPAAGMAIAAGVAAVAVLTMQPAGQPEVGGYSAPLVAANQPAANEPSVVASDLESSYVVPTTTSNNAIIPATRLTNYLVAHGEFSSPLGRRSVWSGVLADDEEVQALEAGEADVQISISNDGAPVR